jgi:hypothetical protein
VVVLPAEAPGARLQRAALLGHRALRVAAGTVQAKLTLGPVGDSYEQEADRVAQNVMHQISSPAPAGAAAPGLAQRLPELKDEDKDKLAKKPLPGAVQRAADKPEEDKLLAKRLPGDVQRSAEDEAVQASSPAGAEGGPIGGDLERSIESARSGGSALDAGVRAQMEPAMGADFSGVRVHADARAHGLNAALQARAFTTGQDIFFGRGEYTPASGSGRELLAHELTHVVQQNGPAVAKKPLD